MSPFIGTHVCKVDSKGRITIPAAFRRYLGNEAGETLIVTRSSDPCLRLYSPDGWQEFQDKLHDLPAGKKKRQVIRFFSMNSATLHLDKQGRVAIPKEFMSAYGMSHEVQLVGTIDNIEVWRPEALAAQVEGAPGALDELEHLL